MGYTSRHSECAVPYPSTLCRWNICRHPLGNSSTARRNEIRPIAPRRLRSYFPISRLRDGESLDTGSSSESTGGDLRRNFISTVFTATRYSQVEKADPPRNELRWRNTWMKASCVRSSASATSFVIRRHTEYTSLLSNW